MTQEEKELVIKDLCGRLPDGVECEIRQREGYSPVLCDKLTCDSLKGIIEYGWYVQPYLRPLSSMTEEERNELKHIFNCDYVEFDCLDFTVGGSVDYDTFCMYYEHCAELIDWLNKKMFDYRNLIEKGLADEAPEEMYNN